MSINDAVLAVNRLAAAYSLEIGRLFSWEDSGDIDDSSSRFISFTTENEPIHISNIDFQFAGTDLTVLRIFRGGTSSGGSIIIPVSNNDYQPGKILYLDNEINVGVSIDTPGVQIAQITFLNPEKDQSVFAEADDGGLILRPDTHYYIEVDNASADPEAFILGIQAGIG